MKLDSIKSRLCTELSDYRYQHSLMVADSSKKLAMIHGVDSEKAYLAGLLHDCAKEFGPMKLKKFLPECREYMYEDELKAPQVWHSFVGAEVAREEYGIEDEEVLSAIRWHSTCRAKASDLDLVVYCADCSVKRGYDSDEERMTVFKICRKDLRAGVLEYLRFEEERGKELGWPFLRHGVEAIEWLEGVLRLR
jgi:predicted HD superfamily hydrolase involved in NAD metabolism